MRIFVGPFSYNVELVRGLIQHEGEPCLGLCDDIRQWIGVSDEPPPEQRISIFWHELAHAWQRWLKVHDLPLDEEAFANLIGLAMPSIDLGTMHRVKHYLVTGQETHAFCGAIFIGPVS